MTRTQKSSRGSSDLDFRNKNIEPSKKDILELVESRKKSFKKIQEVENSKSLFEVSVKLDGPIGILHFGDPHVDSNGTDWVSLERDIKLVKNTPGLFATNVGDTTNNWVGRLGRLYGEQSTTAEEAWMLAEYFIKEVGNNWLYVIGGNHDLWSGAGDPLKWIAKQSNVIYEPYGVRIKLDFPNGEDIYISSRHSYPGRSIWNPTHSTMREAQIGNKDDIIIAGHEHISGYAQIKDPVSGRISHCIQVGTYKRYDSYSKQKGYKNLNIAPSALTIIDSSASNTNKIHLYWDVEAGVDYLTYLRKAAKTKTILL